MENEKFEKLFKEVLKEFEIPLNNPFERCLNISVGRLKNVLEKTYRQGYNDGVEDIKKLL